MYPHPPCKKNCKSTENDRSNRSCSSDKGVVDAHREKIHIIESQTAISMEVHQSHVLKGEAKGGRTIFSIPEIPSQPRIRKKLISQTTRKWNHQVPRFQKMRRQVSLFGSCTLCAQGSAQKQDVAEPPCRPPSLTLSVHGPRRTSKT